MGEPEQIFWDGVTWLWLGFIGLSSLTIAIEQPGFERILTSWLQQLLPLQQRLSGAKFWLSVADVEPRQHVDIIGWLTFLGLIVVMLGLFPYEYALPPGTGLTIELLLLLLALSRLLFLLDDVFIKNLLTRLIRFAYSARMQEAYTQVIQPYTNALKNLAAFVIFDLVLLVVPDQGAIRPVEVPISLGIGLAVSLIGISLFKQFFKVYLLDVTLDSSSGLSIELLSIVRIFANGSIVVMVIVAFSVTHGINLFGLIASLGIGGLAIAFAAKNSLEQLFGSVVLYLDRPFVPGDYVTLKDGTFGRVESIGLRSSKIRTSGRGTLIVIPNNSLASMQI
ncbi:MAG: mechanosensitive ion channel domain-containing protein, partial [Cyanobacteria bacterium P01_H01_bin.121]